MRHIFLAIALLIFSPLHNSQALCQDMRVDAVVFSYDRPMQLYAYLESAEKFLTGLNETHAIYRASSKAYAKGYEVVKKRFPHVRFHKQSSDPTEDFKYFVLASIYSRSSSCTYAMFAVDDMIITQPINVCECTEALEKWKAWGFMLRLGLNINHCYMRNIDTPPPPNGKIEETFFVWKFNDGLGDWKYPNNTDMTIYRKSDLRYPLYLNDYIHPNSLEKSWHQIHNLEKIGICFLSSKVVNLPLNIVNPSKNKNANSYSIKKLLSKFKKGLKIDINRFYNLKNSSPHHESELTFIRRERCIFN